MKKSALVFAITLVVLITVALWFFNEGINVEPQGIFLYSVILIILIFAISIGFSRIKSLNIR